MKERKKGRKKWSEATNQTSHFLQSCVSAKEKRTETHQRRKMGVILLPGVVKGGSSRQKGVGCKDPLVIFEKGRGGERTFLQLSPLERQGGRRKKNGQLELNSEILDRGGGLAERKCRNAVEASRRWLRKKELHRGNFFCPKGGKRKEREARERR